MEERELITEDSEINESLHKIEQNKRLDIENEEECSDHLEDNELEEEFLYLLRINELEEAVELIRSKKIKNLNYRNEDGNTALHFVMANNLEIATYFLLKILKVNYNVYNNNGNSPLVWAVQNKSVEAVRILLLHDYEINLNFIKNNLKEINKYFEKDEIDSYINYNPTCLLKGIKQIEMDKFKLSDDIIEFYKISDNFNPDNKINILKKNNFGKSLLCELFNCNNLELLQLILEHPISYLLDHSLNTTANNNCDEYNKYKKEDNKKEKEKFIIHNFNFYITDNDKDDNINNIGNNNKLTDNNNIRIKEISLNHGDILNSSKSELDKSGMMIWESSIICSFWLYDLIKRNEIYKIETDKIINNNFNKEVLNNKELFENNKIKKNEFENVIELGSGCGLVGISFFKFCHFLKKKFKKIILSDLSNNTINNLKYNINLNNNSCIINNDNNNNNNGNNIQVIKLDWKNFEIKEKFQIVIGSDLIYDSSLVNPLIKTIDKLLDERGIFLYCFKLLRNGSNELINELVNNNYLVELRQVPREYQRNPLIGKSKEYCLSFFQDLESDDYFLIKAVKLPNV